MNKFCFIIITNFFTFLYCKSQNLVLMYKFLIVALIFLSCKHEKANRISVAKPQKISISTQINYDSCKRKIDTIKNEWKNEWKALSLIEKSNIFTDAITKTIVPAWIGTQWEFNGTSEIPNKGSIACGYFVTTVLRDSGLPIARIKLAQCASEEMIKTLVSKQNISRFSNSNFKVFISFLKTNHNGLYVIGLDNHTGFILKDDAEIWFIHSTFIGNGRVQKEIAEKSSILKNSKYKIVGKISVDENTLNRWIKN